MNEIDWTEFDQWPPAEVLCQCGAEFHSHSKFVGALGKHLLRVPCPGCGRNDAARRISHPPERWDIQR